MENEATTEVTEETTIAAVETPSVESEKVEKTVEDEAVKETEPKEEAKAETGDTVKAEARKWEARSKANKAEADSLKVQVDSFEKELIELRDKDSKVGTEVTELRIQLTGKVTEAARYKAALENGLTIEDTAFLTGSNDEEIAASAKRFAERVGASAGRPTMRTQGAPVTKSKPQSLRESILDQLRELDENPK